MENKEFKFDTDGFKYYHDTYVKAKIEGAINALDSEKSQTAGTDGLALSITETDGKITAISGSIAANTYDANGAASTAKSEVIGGATSSGNTLKKLEDRVSPLETSVGTGGSVDSRISSAVATETTRAQAAEQLLQEQYDALTQSDIVVGALPASGTKNLIYRVPGTNTYSDYMWDGTQFVKMAEYNNAIDDEPTAGSDNLVKSSGVYNNLSIINTYANRIVVYESTSIPNVISAQKGDYLILSIKGNSSELFMSTLNNNTLAEEDKIKLSASEQNVNVKVKLYADCNGVRFFSTTSQTVDFRITIVKQSTKDIDFTNTLYEGAFYKTDEWNMFFPNTLTGVIPNDYLDVKIFRNGTSGRLLFGLITGASTITQDDLVELPNGSDSIETCVKVTASCSGFKVFGQPGRYSIQISKSLEAPVLYNELTNKINNSIAENNNIVPEYKNFIMTSFDNSIQRLRVYLSDNGINFKEFVHDYNLNAGNDVRDPDIIKVNGWYYISITGEVIKIYKTQDFKEYSLHASIDPQLQNTYAYWAPELFKDVNGDIYMIFAHAITNAGEWPTQVDQYIAKMNSDLTALAETPAKLEFPSLDDPDAQIDTTICYWNGYYYSACYGKTTMKIYSSTSLKSGYTVIKEINLLDVAPSNKYFEGPTIIHQKERFYVYVTQTYPSWQSGWTKGIAVYVFDEEWNLVDFKWCRYYSDYPDYSSGETNILIGEHPKILPIINWDSAKIINDFL